MHPAFTSVEPFSLVSPRPCPRTTDLHTCPQNSHQNAFNSSQSSHSRVFHSRTLLPPFAVFNQSDSTVSDTRSNPPYSELSGHHIDSRTHKMAELRRLNLSLLLEDLLSHVRHSYPKYIRRHPLQPLYAQLNHLRHTLPSKNSDDPALRASIRRLLWSLRQLLDAHNPPRYLRASLERARSAALDIPRTIDDASDAALLREQITIGKELCALRELEHDVELLLKNRLPEQAHSLLLNTRYAFMLLGKDDYRVRGKRRVVEALSMLRAEIDDQGDVESTCNAIAEIELKLTKSFEYDLKQKRPAGNAMLLRPGLHDIPNFDIVQNGFLRGGQPSASGLEWLVNYGVCTIIDLRGTDRLNQWCLPKETLGLQVCHIPVEDFSTPCIDQVQLFCSTLRENIQEQRVVFVHCKAGIGRTGTFTACWRIANGADVEEALHKERLYCDGGGGLKQENFVRDYASWIDKMEPT